MPFEKSVLVPLSADETFALITEPDRLRRWQTITARVDLRAGGDYRWTIIPGHSARGTFTEVEPGRRVVFTWGWEGDADLPPGASTVTITLEPSAGGTIVRLVHDGLTGEQAPRHGDGWTHSLGRLVLAGTPGDPRAHAPAAAQPVLEAWNARGLEGTVKLGSSEMPAAAALGIGSIEFLVHAWDFAQATGQQVTVPEGVAAYVLDVAGQIITPELRSSGSFADAVPAGPDAHVMDRLVGFPGRAAPLAPAEGERDARTHLIRPGASELGGPADHGPARREGVLGAPVRLDLRRPADG